MRKKSSYLFQASAAVFVLACFKMCIEQEQPGQGGLRTGGNIRNFSFCGSAVLAPS